MLKQFLLENLLRQRQKKMKVNVDFKVKDYLKKIPLYFDPAKAADRRLTVVYEIHDSGDNDGAWTVVIASGKCEVSEGEAEQFDTKLYTTAEVYRRILTGLMEISRLPYSTGAVRFYGNSLGHRELNAYITIPKGVNLAAL